jgi:hypothetical protein
MRSISLDHAEHFTGRIDVPASLRSDGVRDHPGMPFGFPPELAFSFAGILMERFCELLVRFKRPAAMAFSKLCQALCDAAIDD